MQLLYIKESAHPVYVIDSTASLLSGHDDGCQKPSKLRNTKDEGLGIRVFTCVAVTVFAAADLAASFSTEVLTIVYSYLAPYIRPPLLLIFHQASPLDF